MKVFKRGDRVRRVGPSYSPVVHGGVYTVARVSTDNSLILYEVEGLYDENHFELVEGAAPPATKDTNPKDAVGDKKIPLWLCSPIAKAQWAVAQFAGMCKYGAWNWRKAGVRSSVYLSAMERHMDAYKSGEEFDPVDGTHHLGNIMACCAILLDAKAAGKLTDDRPPSVGVRKDYDELMATMAKLREQYKDMKPYHYTIADTEVQA